MDSGFPTVKGISRRRSEAVFLYRGSRIFLDILIGHCAWTAVCVEEHGNVTTSPVHEPAVYCSAFHLQYAPININIAAVCSRVTGDCAPVHIDNCSTIYIKSTAPAVIACSWIYASQSTCICATSVNYIQNTKICQIINKIFYYCINPLLSKLITLHFHISSIFFTTSATS